jgi:hypothetical protein
MYIADPFVAKLVHFQVGLVCVCVCVCVSVCLCVCAVCSFIHQMYIADPFVHFQVGKREREREREREGERRRETKREEA